MIVKVVGIPAECLSAILVHRRVTDFLVWIHCGLGHLAAEFGWWLWALSNLCKSMAESILY